MKVLIDTHVFLWGLQAEAKLSQRVRELLPAEDIWISVASLWEIIAKVRVKKLDMPLPVGEYLVKKLTMNGISVLPLTLKHALKLEALPLHHRDPFDRILIAQSIEEGWPILTADPWFARYPVNVIW